MPLPYSSPIQGWSKRLACWVRAEEVMEKSSKNLRRQQRVFDAVGKKTDGGVQLPRGAAGVEEAPKASKRARS